MDILIDENGNKMNFQFNRLTFGQTLFSFWIVAVFLGGMFLTVGAFLMCFFEVLDILDRSNALARSSEVIIGAGVFWWIYFFLMLPTWLISFFIFKFYKMLGFFFFFFLLSLTTGRVGL